jgi:hypothetical protein
MKVHLTTDSLSVHWIFPPGTDGLVGGGRPLKPQAACELARERVLQNFLEENFLD